MQGTPSDILEAHLLELAPHVVDVEAELTIRKSAAFLLLRGLTRAPRLEHFRGADALDDADTVIVGDDDVAGLDCRSRADDRHVDRSKRRLDRPLRENCLRPNWKTHERKVANVTHARVNDQAATTARHRRGCEEIAEVA